MMKMMKLLPQFVNFKRYSAVKRCYYRYSGSLTHSSGNIHDNNVPKIGNFIINNNNNNGNINNIQQSQQSQHPEQQQQQQQEQEQRQEHRQELPNKNKQVQRYSGFGYPAKECQRINDEMIKFVASNGDKQILASLHSALNDTPSHLLTEVTANGYTCLMDSLQLALYFKSSNSIFLDYLGIDMFNAVMARCNSIADRREKQAIVTFLFLNENNMYYNVFQKAIHFGSPKLFKVVSNAVLQAHKDNILSAKDFTSLYVGFNRGKFSSLRNLLNSSSIEIAQTYFATIKEVLLENNYITQDDVRKLFVTPDIKGQIALHDLFKCANEKTFFKWMLDLYKKMVGKEFLALAFYKAASQNSPLDFAFQAYRPETYPVFVQEIHGFIEDKNCTSLKDLRLFIIIILKHLNYEMKSMVANQWISRPGYNLYPPALPITIQHGGLIYSNGHYPSYKEDEDGSNICSADENFIQLKKSNVSTTLYNLLVTKSMDNNFNGKNAAFSHSVHKRLLISILPSGLSPLQSIIKTQNSEAVGNYFQILLEAAKNSVISDEDYKGVILGGYRNMKETPMKSVLNSRNVNIFTIFMNHAKQAYNEVVIYDQHFKDMLFTNCNEFFANFTDGDELLHVKYLHEMCDFSRNPICNRDDYICIIKHLLNTNQRIRNSFAKYHARDKENIANLENNTSNNSNVKPRETGNNYFPNKENNDSFFTTDKSTKLESKSLANNIDKKFRKPKNVVR